MKEFDNSNNSNDFALLVSIVFVDSSDSTGRFRLELLAYHHNYEILLHH